MVTVSPLLVNRTDTAVFTSRKFSYTSVHQVEYKAVWKMRGSNCLDQCIFWNFLLDIWVNNSLRVVEIVTIAVQLADWPW